MLLQNGISKVRWSALHHQAWWSRICRCTNPFPPGTNVEIPWWGDLDRLIGKGLLGRVSHGRHGLLEEDGHQMILFLQDHRVEWSHEKDSILSSPPVMNHTILRRLRRRSDHFFCTNTFCPNYVYFLLSLRFNRDNSPYKATHRSFGKDSAMSIPASTQAASFSSFWFL